MKTVEAVRREICAVEARTERVKENLLKVSKRVADPKAFVWRTFKAELHNYNPIQGTVDVRITANYTVDKTKQKYSAVDTAEARYIAQAINELLPAIAKKAIEIAEDDALGELFDLDIELLKAKGGAAGVLPRGTTD
jgi:hypothetical protein